MLEWGVSYPCLELGSDTRVEVRGQLPVLGVRVGYPFLELGSDTHVEVRGQLPVWSWKGISFRAGQDQTVKKQVEIVLKSQWKSGKAIEKSSWVLINSNKSSESQVKAGGVTSLFVNNSKGLVWRKNCQLSCSSRNLRLLTVLIAKESIANDESIFWCKSAKRPSAYKASRVVPLVGQLSRRSKATALAVPLCRYWRLR